MDKFWIRIEKYPLFNDTPLYNENVPFKVDAVDAHCMHCLADIQYMETGYVSWVDEIDGQQVISSGYKTYSTTCPCCGGLNDPWHEIYVQALDRDTGAPFEYKIPARSFFSKVDFKDYQEEYLKEGELIFIIRR